MPRPTSPTARRLPTLLLLGLLALLLWGQCALLFPGVSTSPPALEGWVERTDSLRTVPPPALFLTLRLHNTLQTPVTVQRVSGSLRFGTRDFPFAAPALRGRRLLIFDELTQAVAVPLSLRADSLALLRTLLDATNARSGQVSLRWQVRYAPDQPAGTAAPGRTNSFLPPLPR